MLGLGMASSHAPMMFQKAQYWPRVMERLQREALEDPVVERLIDAPGVVHARKVREPAGSVDRDAFGPVAERLVDGRTFHRPQQNRRSEKIQQQKNDQ